MKIREAIKYANKDLIKVLKHDHWELRESMRFYKQAVSDFIYATKTLLKWIFTFLILLLIPILYPIAIIIRMVKK